MKAIMFDQLNPLDAANQEMTGFARKEENRYLGGKAGSAYWDRILGEWMDIIGGEGSSDAGIMIGYSSSGGLVASISNIASALGISREAFKEFIAIVVGESSNNSYEAAAIAGVILNRLNHKKAPMEGDFISKIGGKGQFDAIGGKAYSEIMAMSFDEITDETNPYRNRIAGAYIGFFSHMFAGLDFSFGAYFWNATNPKTGFNWNTYDKGIFTITVSYGGERGTTFFKYKNNQKKWP